jgi:hypothetical protein
MTPYRVEAAFGGRPEWGAMKRLALSILAAAAALDVASDPHSRRLIANLVDAGPGQSMLGMILASPIVAKIEYWGAALLLLVIVSLMMSSRRRTGPDILGR